VTNGHTAVSVAADAGGVVDVEVVDVVDPGPVVVVVWLVDDDMDPHPITTKESANTVAANASFRCLLISNRDGPPAGGEALRPGGGTLDLASLEWPARVEDEEALRRRDELETATLESLGDSARRRANKDDRLLDARVERRSAAAVSWR
jgi:hypothetical protein